MSVVLGLSNRSHNNYNYNIMLFITILLFLLSVILYLIRSVGVCVYTNVCDGDHIHLLSCFSLTIQETVSLKY